MLITVTWNETNDDLLGESTDQLFKAIKTYQDDIDTPVKKSKEKKKKVKKNKVMPVNINTDVGSGVQSIASNKEDSDSASELSFKKKKWKDDKSDSEENLSDLSDWAGNVFNYI